MTGHEAKGFCFLCGKSVKNRRFCDKQCQNNYQNHFIWKFASAWCIERADNKCEKCGVEQNCGYDYEGWDGDFGTRLEAHHIDPLNNEYRHYNKKNRPENLICLCNRCHSHINSQIKEDKPIEKKQLVLF